MPERWVKLTGLVFILVTGLLLLQGYRSRVDNWVLTVLRKPKIITVHCIGDSITYGNGSHTHDGAVKKKRGNYPLTLKRLLSEAFPDIEFSVKNFGVSGATVMDNVLAKSVGLGKPERIGYKGTDEFSAAFNSQPDMTVLMLGTNDAKVPIEQWTAPMKKKWKIQARKILTQLLPEKNSPFPSSLLGTWVMLPPEIVDEFMTKAQKKSTRPQFQQAVLDGEIKALWRAVVANLGSKSRGDIFPLKKNPMTGGYGGNVPHLEIMDASKVMSKKCKRCYSDSVHPTDFGSERIAQMVFKTLSKRIAATHV